MVNKIYNIRKGYPLRKLLSMQRFCNIDCLVKNSEIHPSKNYSPAELSRNYSGTSVFLTPAPIVKMILDGIRYVLEKCISPSMTLWDEDLVFIDPALGNGNFPIGLFDFVQSKLSYSDYFEWLTIVVKKNLFAYELEESLLNQAKSRIYESLEQLFVNYQKEIHSAVDPSSHIRSPFKKFEKCDNNKRRDLKLQFYKRNTLDSPASSTEVISRLSMAEKNSGVIIFGNPPYAISSKSKTPWIHSLIEDYKHNLNRKGKKKLVGLKGIQDDYVKFMRWAQWCLSFTSKPGVLAFVVNNYFLDGDIFRGMRIYLKEQFDIIYIIDLHGDPKRPPQNVGISGITDENLFSIQTGVCLFIGLIIPTKQSTRSSRCKVYYTDVWGNKAQKMAFLQQSFATLPFIEVSDQVDHEFTPISKIEQELQQTYAKFSYLPDIFKTHIVGVQSLHDTLVTHPDPTRLRQILTSFYANEFDQRTFSDEKGQFWLKSEGVTYHDARDWKIADGKKGSLELALSSTIQWQWRGLDRWAVTYNQHLMTRGSSGFRVLQTMLPSYNNRAILVPRVSRKASGLSSILMTNTIAESHCVEGGSGIGDYVFPFKTNDLINRNSDWEHPLPPRSTNLSFKIYKALENQYGGPFSELEEHIFYYIYAILWTPQFSLQYQFLLKKDFPRIPFPTKKEFFHRMAHLGKLLGDLHCFSSPSLTLNKFEDRFPHSPIPPSPENHVFIKKPLFDQASSYLYFDGGKKEFGFWIKNISQEIWDFDIGGYPQLSSWLKWRRYRPKSSEKGITHKYQFTRGLRAEEIRIFFQMVVIIQQTIQIRKELDELYNIIRQTNHPWFSLNHLHE